MDGFQSLYRTFKPKINHYAINGGGRDTYIVSDHGGMVKPAVRPDILQRKGQFYTHNQYSTPAPRLTASPLQYHSDGSGRDFYIGCNSGGLKYTYQPGGTRDIFKQSLRADMRRTQNDFWKTTQGFLGYRSRITAIKQTQTVKNVTKRLFSMSPRQLRHPADNLNKTLNQRQLQRKNLMSKIFFRQIYLKNDS